MTILHNLTTEQYPDFRRVRIAEGRILEIDFQDAQHADVPDFCNIFNRKVGKEVLQRIQVCIKNVHMLHSYNLVYYRKN
jgi:hypothetical protein